MRMNRSAVAASFAALISVGALLAPTPSQAATARQQVAQTAPAWLAKAVFRGPAAAAAPVSFRLYLSPRGGLKAEEALALAVSTPNNPLYRKFITPAEYHHLFDPTAASVSTVQSWLRSTGLRVTAAADTTGYLSVTGSVAVAQRAFSTVIRKYTHDGLAVQANASTLTVPATVAASVLTVTGLDTTPAYDKTSTAPAPPDPAYLSGKPCSAAYGQLTANTEADGTPLPKFEGRSLPYAVCGYAGSTFRTAYEKGSSLTGAGVTIGIVDAFLSPYLHGDVTTYAARNGDPAYAANQLTLRGPVSPTNQLGCDAGGWYGEADLDVEAAHAMAPGAKIDFYGAKTCDDVTMDDEVETMINANQVTIASFSFGDVEALESTGEQRVAHRYYLQAALQGISIVAASGDNGDEQASNGVTSVDTSVNDPFVTGVGATATDIDQTGKIVSQTGWGTNNYTLATDGKSWVFGSFLYGSGGGFSQLYSRPSYQYGVVPASAPAGRAVPDVAMNGDVTTGMLIGQSQTFPDGVHYSEYRIGGTSLSSPLFAGMTALLLQHTGDRLGMLNPLIYDQYRTGRFTDVTAPFVHPANVRSNYKNGIDASTGITYIVRTFDQDSSLQTTAGWDDVTGIGTPNTGWLTTNVSARY